MKKRNAIFAVQLWIAVAAFLVAADIQKVSTSDVVSERLGLPTSTYHPWTDQEYLAPREFPVQGGIMLAIAGNEDTPTAIALLDSIAQGLGPVWGDVDSVNAQLDLTIFIDPDSTQAVRVGSHMTIAEVQSAATKPWVEIATTNSKRWGKNATFFNRDSLLSKLDQWQDWADANLPTEIVTHRWGRADYTGGGDGYQLGVGSLMQSRGYYWGIRMAQQPNLVFNQVAGFDGSGMNNVNYWQFASARFAYGGEAGFVGIHTIGESIDRYNLGCRVWDVADVRADSVRKYVDLGLQSFGMSTLIFDGSVVDSASTKDCTYATFRKIVAHCVHRVAEGKAEALKAEEMGFRMNGIRVDELIPHNGFTVLANDTTYSKGIVSNLSGKGSNGIDTGKCRYPMGWSQAVQHIVNSNDTLATPGRPLTITGGTDNMAVMRLAVVGDSIAAIGNTVGGSPDSARYGLVSPDGNVIMFTSTNGVRSRTMPFQVTTIGCRSRAVEITGQVQVTSNTTFGGTPGDTLYLAGIALQSSEEWGNYMDEGPSAYQQLSNLWTTYQARPDTTVYPDSLHAKTRIKMLGISRIAMASDSSYTGPFSLIYGDGAAASEARWWRDAWWHNMDRLNPFFLLGTQTSDWTMFSSLSSYRNISSPPEIVDHEPHYQHWSLIVAPGAVHDFRWVVDIDELTDYVAGYLFIENRSGTTTPAGFIATLHDFHARPL